MKVERIVTDAPIVQKVTAEKLAKEEKQTLTADAVSLDLEKRGAKDQGGKDTRKERSTDDKADLHPPAEEHLTASRKLDIVA